MTNQPTQVQCDQAIVAQQEFGDLIDRLIGEGFDYRSILAGAGAAIAHSIVAAAGPEKVAAWFAQNAELAAGLMKGKPN